MKKLFAVWCVLMVSLSVFAQSNSMFVYKPWNEVLELAKKQDKIILVEVSDPGRMKDDYRAKVEKELFAEGETGKLLADKFLCTRINVANDAEYEPFAPFIAGFQYPCYLMIFHNGKKVGYYPDPTGVLNDKNGFLESLKKAAAMGDVKRQNTREIVFQKMSFEEAKKKAKAENKLIFIDAMFEGCHWCKEMENDTYTLNNVADYYNSNFICLQIDFLKEAYMAKAYPSEGYPSYFYIDSNGKLWFQEDGYTSESEKFIGYGKTAISKWKGK